MAKLNAKQYTIKTAHTHGDKIERMPGAYVGEYCGGMVVIAPIHKHYDGGRVAIVPGKYAWFGRSVVSEAFVQLKLKDAKRITIDSL